jgi:hypothetical protein
MLLNVSMIVDVHCEDDSIQIAKVIGEDEFSYHVLFLAKNDKLLYEFENNTEFVPKESVCGFYDVENIEDTGLYRQTFGGYEEVDEGDEDYECPDSSESDDDDVSLVDEDEA